MAFIEWDDSYSVNVQKIDKQHRQLIKLINDLSDAMKARKGKESLEAILNGLVEYAKTHFALEENYFDKFGYPYAVAHKEEHTKFMKNVLEFNKGLMEGRLLLSLDIMNFLNEWLINHIKGFDKNYSKFFNDAGLT